MHDAETSKTRSQTGKVRRGCGRGSPCRLEAAVEYKINGAAMKLWRKPFDQAERATKLGKVLISQERCKGCGYCVEFCPTGALRMSEELSPKGYYLAAVADESKCLNCGLCEILCPEFGIRLVSSNDKD